ncbi:hypothetical protein NEOLEDRAFT_1073718 [Neolentinus lepideus HHB14362 ss-1]|uniref:Palmitoyltransferase n=1 Tax=Neolentinus lepideus HHB14362 ss-1 TaxID=1314782 RepID=A0A165PPL5_9AGAM|nr:hypothetical protein NEOLEDRAFT_1073718 [Neolentinus lepideus HHB14362 ss-1]
MFSLPLFLLYSSPLQRNSKIAIFILPTIFLYLTFVTLSILPWYTGMILALAEFFGMHHIVTRVLLNNSSYTDNVAQSPYFAGIITGSMLWVGYCWITRLVHQTSSHAIAHLVFALSFGLCAYNFFRSITLDPGSCPKPQSDEELKSIIETLAGEGRLNGQTFCINCMARRPLRSKHCRVCDRCVARSDQYVYLYVYSGLHAILCLTDRSHCPWVWNCGTYYCLCANISH